MVQRSEETPQKVCLPGKCVFIFSWLSFTLGGGISVFVAFQILVQVKEVLSKLPSLIEITLKEVSTLHVPSCEAYFYIHLFKRRSCLWAFVTISLFPQSDKITICGDTHGQYYDLLNIFKLNGLPSETNPYVSLLASFCQLASHCWSVCVQLYSQS